MYWLWMGLISTGTKGWKFIHFCKNQQFLLLMGTKEYWAVEIHELFDLQIENCWLVELQWKWHGISIYSFFFWYFLYFVKSPQYICCIKLNICNKQNIYSWLLINSVRLPTAGGSWNPGPNMVVWEGVILTWHIECQQTAQYSDLRSICMYGISYKVAFGNKEN